MRTALKGEEGGELNAVSGGSVKQRCRRSRSGESSKVVSYSRFVS